MQNVSVAHIRMKKVSVNELLDVDDELVVEEPLEINVRYNSIGIPVQKCISITMRTPGNDEELAVGFLFTEGIIQKREEVSEVSAVPFAGNKVLITLSKNKQPLLQNAERNFYTTSSCGVCGKTSIDAIRQSFPAIESTNVRMDIETLLSLPEKLQKAQGDFARTGGIHAAGIFDSDGELKTVREDIGRHNAVDKVVGRAFLDGLLPLNRHVLLVSGRASFEIVQKALAAGIPIVAAVSAPSTLAADFARESNQTLIGFLRPPLFNVYSHIERIILEAL